MTTLSQMTNALSTGNVPDPEVEAERVLASVARHGGRAITQKLALRVEDFATEGRYQTIIGVDPRYPSRGGASEVPVWIAALGGTSPDPDALAHVWSFMIDPAYSSKDNGWGWDFAERTAKGHDGSARPMFLSQAEAMLDWPIYREALGLSAEERDVLVEAIDSHREDVRWNISNGDYDDDDVATAKAHVAKLDALEQKLA